jgi:hypothetical protein
MELDGGEWSATCVCTLFHRKIPRYPLYGSLDATEKGKTFTTIGDQIQIFQAAQPIT